MRKGGKILIITGLSHVSWKWPGEEILEVREKFKNFSLESGKLTFPSKSGKCGINVIDHFTVVCLVTWPLHGSEARVDPVLIQTSLLLSYKCT